MKNQKEVMELAAELHKGQTREDGIEPYVNHPLRVSTLYQEYTWSSNQIMIALLHDTIEDCGVTEDDLVMKHGVPPAVAMGVAMLSRVKDESYVDFIHRIGKSFKSMRDIKIADIKDNLRNHKKSSRRDKYELALALLQSYGDLEEKTTVILNVLKQK